MRKHFLILMLLTLLPLSTWALDLSQVYDVRVSYPQAQQIIYNAQNRTGIAWNIEVQMEVNGPWTAIDLADVTLTYHATQSGAEISTVKNVGTYYVGIATSGGLSPHTGSVPDTKRPHFVISPCPLTIVAQNATKVYGDADPATLQWAVKAGQTLPEPAENIPVTFNYHRTVAVTSENVRQQEKVNQTTGYALTGVATATNYDIRVEGPNGAEHPVLFITPKTLTVSYGKDGDAPYTAAGTFFTKTYGADNSTIFTNAIHVEYDGFVENLGGFADADDTKDNALVAEGVIIPIQNTEDANVTSAGANLDPAIDPYTIDFSHSTLAAVDGNYNIVYAARYMKIKQIDIDDTNFFFQKSAETATTTYTYNGLVQSPVFEVYKGGNTAAAAILANKLVADHDYTLTVNENSGVAKNARSYTVKLQGKGNYGGTIDAVAAFAYEIQKKQLNVIVLDETKTYDGEVVAEPTNGWRVSYSGWIGDDNEDMTGFQKATVSITSAAANVKEGGYEIKLTQPATANENYSLALTNGKFVVTPLLGVKIKATDKSKTYGTADNTGAGAFSLEVDATGTAPANNTDRTALTNLANIAVTRDLTVTVDGETEKVGKYPNALIAAWKMSGEPLAPTAAQLYANYGGGVEGGLTFVPGNFTISKAKVTIITIGDTKVYGQSDAYASEAGVQGTSANMAVTGQREGDAIGDVIKTYPTLTRVAGEDVGYYDITIKEGLELTENYDLDNVDYSYGRLRITPKALTITPLEQAVPVMTEGTPTLDQAAVVMNGLIDNDNASDIDYTVAYAGDYTFATQTTINNGIKITIPATPAEGKKNKNYTITATATANLVITSGTADLYLNADDGNLAAKIAANNGKTVNVKIKLNRGTKTVAGLDDAWRAFQWNALVLPFDVTVKEVSQAFGYAIVNVINPAGAGRYTSGTGKVSFKLKMDNQVIPANTPFMVKTYDAVATDGVVIFGSHKIKAPAEDELSKDASTTESGLGFKFIGTYAEKAINDQMPEYQFMVNSETYNNLQFIRKDSELSFAIIPYNAYFYLPAASGEAHQMEITFEEADGSTTTIRNFTVDNNSLKANADGWYTLNGVKLNAAPTQKGVYINNGKKIVIK